MYKLVSMSEHDLFQKKFAMKDTINSCSRKWAITD